MLHNPGVLQSVPVIWTFRYSQCSWLSHQSIKDNINKLDRNQEDRYGLDQTSACKHKWFQSKDCVPFRLPPTFSESISSSNKKYPFPEALGFSYTLGDYTAHCNYYSWKTSTEDLKIQPSALWPRAQRWIKATISLQLSSEVKVTSEFQKMSYMANMLLLTLLGKESRRKQNVQRTTELAYSTQFPASSEIKGLSFIATRRIQEKQKVELYLLYKLRN